MLSTVALHTPVIVAGALGVPTQLTRGGFRHVAFVAEKKPHEGGTCGGTQTVNGSLLVMAPDAGTLMKNGDGVCPPTTSGKLPTGRRYVSGMPPGTAIEMSGTAIVVFVSPLIMKTFASSHDENVMPLTASTARPPSALVTWRDETTKVP